MEVAEGIATVRRSRGAPESDGERATVETLARTVPGVVAAHVLPDDPGPGSRPPG
ncbi:hypothetical protein O2V63_08825 [Modestobacter sp. VKM Ac-2977]|uniref:hypothetical protein n=1 Tax=Modestobacter sp. VKM Ac-2977 TaxID=3004131 RepID=UPI0022AAF0B6|nr:hypothetical protein [Modestobacter sp. VKM Ac-2977]MCZ2820429.1 hypothetical protein [Modestobacter sp. VKM Ac-2977]